MSLFISLVPMLHSPAFLTRCTKSWEVEAGNEANCYYSVYCMFHLRLIGREINDFIISVLRNHRYFHDVQAVLLIYDATSLPTLKNIKSKWLPLVNDRLPPDIIKILGEDIVFVLREHTNIVRE